jgi:hypothetical protein
MEAKTDVLLAFLIIFVTVFIWNEIFSVSVLTILMLVYSGSWFHIGNGESFQVADFDKHQQ